MRVSRRCIRLLLGVAVFAGASAQTGDRLRDRPQRPGPQRAGDGAASLGESVPDYIDYGEYHPDYDYYGEPEPQQPPSRLDKLLPLVTFQCRRGEGYYADPDFDCEMFHYCGADGTRYSFLCGEGSKFHQKTMICDFSHKLRCGEDGVLQELPHVSLSTGHPFPGGEIMKKGVTTSPDTAQHPGRPATRPHSARRPAAGPERRPERRPEQRPERRPERRPQVFPPPLPARRRQDTYPPQPETGVRRHQDTSAPAPQPEPEVPRRQSERRRQSAGQPARPLDRYRERSPTRRRHGGADDRYQAVLSDIHDIIRDTGAFQLPVLPLLNDGAGAAQRRHDGPDGGPAETGPPHRLHLPQRRPVTGGGRRDAYGPTPLRRPLLRRRQRQVNVEDEGLLALRDIIDTKVGKFFPDSSAAADRRWSSRSGTVQQQERDFDNRFFGEFEPLAPRRERLGSLSRSAAEARSDEPRWSPPVENAVEVASSSWPEREPTVSASRLARRRPGGSRHPDTDVGPQDASLYSVHELDTAGFGTKMQSIPPAEPALQEPDQYTAVDASTEVPADLQTAATTTTEQFDIAGYGTPKASSIIEEPKQASSVVSERRSRPRRQRVRQRQFVTRNPGVDALRRLQQFPFLGPALQTSARLPFTPPQPFVNSQFVNVGPQGGGRFLGQTGPFGGGRQERPRAPPGSSQSTERRPTPTAPSQQRQPAGPSRGGAVPPQAFSSARRPFGVAPQQPPQFQLDGAFGPPRRFRPAGGAPPTQQPGFPQSSVQDPRFSSPPRVINIGNPLPGSFQPIPSFRRPGPSSSAPVGDQNSPSFGASSAVGDLSPPSSVAGISPFARGQLPASFVGTPSAPPTRGGVQARQPGGRFRFGDFSTGLVAAPNPFGFNTFVAPQFVRGVTPGFQRLPSQSTPSPPVGGEKPSSEPTGGQAPGQFVPTFLPTQRPTAVASPPPPFSAFGGVRPGVFGTRQPGVFGAPQPGVFGAPQPGVFGGRQPQPTTARPTPPSPPPSERPRQPADGPAPFGSSTPGPTTGRPIDGLDGPTSDDGTAVGVTAQPPPPPPHISSPLPTDVVPTRRPTASRTQRPEPTAARLPPAPEPTAVSPSGGRRGSGRRRIRLRRPGRRRRPGHNDATNEVVDDLPGGDRVPFDRDFTKQVISRLPDQVIRDVISGGSNSIIRDAPNLVTNEITDDAVRTAPERRPELKNSGFTTSDTAVVTSTIATTTTTAAATTTSAPPTRRFGRRPSRRRLTGRRRTTTASPAEAAGEDTTSDEATGASAPASTPRKFGRRRPAGGGRRAGFRSRTRNRLRPSGRQPPADQAGVAAAEEAEQPADQVEATPSHSPAADQSTEQAGSDVTTEQPARGRRPSGFRTRMRRPGRRRTRVRTTTAGPIAAVTEVVPTTPTDVAPAAAGSAAAESEAEVTDDGEERGIKATAADLRQMRERGLEASRALATAAKTTQERLRLLYERRRNRQRTGVVRRRPAAARAASDGDAVDADPPAADAAETSDAGRSGGVPSGRIGSRADGRTGGRRLTQGRLRLRTERPAASPGRQTVGATEAEADVSVERAEVPTEKPGPEKPETGARPVRRRFRPDGFRVRQRTQRPSTAARPSSARSSTLASLLETTEATEATPTATSALVTVNQEGSNMEQHDSPSKRTLLGGVRQRTPTRPAAGRPSAAAEVTRTTITPVLVKTENPAPRATQPLDVTRDGSSLPPASTELAVASTEPVTDAAPTAASSTEPTATRHATERTAERHRTTPTTANPTTAGPTVAANVEQITAAVTRQTTGAGTATSTQDQTTDATSTEDQTAAASTERVVFIPFDNSDMTLDSIVELVAATTGAPIDTPAITMATDPPLLPLQSLFAAF